MQTEIIFRSQGFYYSAMNKFLQRLKLCLMSTFDSKYVKQNVEHTLENKVVQFFLLHWIFYN